jgi:hypothetical protein
LNDELKQVKTEAETQSNAMSRVIGNIEELLRPGGPEHFLTSVLGQLDAVQEEYRILYQAHMQLLERS